MPRATPARRWTGFRSILCPVDFSDQSRQALRYAEAIAVRARAPLQVVYANDPLLVAAAAAALHDRDIAKRSGVELDAFVKETLGQAARGLRVKTRAAVGKPADVILKAAASTRADLIVLGTHGLTGADRLIMGSTTLAILQRAKMPVLAVPRGLQDGGRPPASWPGRQIVAAVEVDAGATKEIEHAARVADWFGASLLLLHVVSPIGLPRWFEGDLSALEEARAARAKQQLAALAGAADGRVRIDTQVVHGRVADEIAAFTAASGTGLMLIALRDRTGWFGASRGSISYHVLSHAAAPVLACPPRWRPR
jgi:nucleotide-binding universal stress UspA family protein